MGAGFRTLAQPWTDAAGGRGVVWGLFAGSFCSAHASASRRPRRPRRGQTLAGW